MIFKPHMIDAILAGRKTQTRPLVKPGDCGLWYQKPESHIVAVTRIAPINDWDTLNGKPLELVAGTTNQYLSLPTRWYLGNTYAVQPGRGKPAVWWRYERFKIDKIFGPFVTEHHVSGHDDRYGEVDAYWETDVRPELKHAGYQPLRIRITAIRRERLQDITEADAQAEGVESVEAYRQLWDSINGKTKGARWQDNPAVWALTFEVVK